MVTFIYDIDGILHVSAQSSGGDFRERLILNPNPHLTEEGKERAMERIRQIQLAAQGDQRDQLLLERALRLYTQTIGQGREMAAGLIDYWKSLMDCGDRIQRRRAYQAALSFAGDGEEAPALPPARKNRRTRAGPLQTVPPSLTRDQIPSRTLRRQRHS